MRIDRNMPKRYRCCSFAEGGDSRADFLFLRGLILCVEVAHSAHMCCTPCEVVTFVCVVLMIDDRLSMTQYIHRHVDSFGLGISLVSRSIDRSLCPLRLGWPLCGPVISVILPWDSRQPGKLLWTTSKEECARQKPLSG